jgi:hypothetical protein
MKSRNALSIQAEHDQEILDILTEAHVRSISAPLLRPVRALPVALTAYVMRAPIADRIARAARLMGWRVVK